MFSNKRIKIPPQEEKILLTLCDVCEADLSGGFEAGSEAHSPFTLKVLQFYCF